MGIVIIILIGVLVLKIFLLIVREIRERVRERRDKERRDKERRERKELERKRLAVIRIPNIINKLKEQEKIKLEEKERELKLKERELQDLKVVKIRTILSEAIQGDFKVKIVYTNYNGEKKQRVLSSIIMSEEFNSFGYINQHIKAFCHLRNEERSFRISRISSIELLK